MSFIYELYNDSDSGTVEKKTCIKGHSAQVFCSYRLCNQEFLLGTGAVFGVVNSVAKG